MYMGGLPPHLPSHCFDCLIAECTASADVTRLQRFLVRSTPSTFIGRCAPAADQATNARLKFASRARMREKAGHGLPDSLVRRIFDILRSADAKAMSRVMSDHANLEKLRHEHRRRICRREPVPFSAHALA